MPLFPFASLSPLCSAPSFQVCVLCRDWCVPGFPAILCRLTYNHPGVCPGVCVGGGKGDDLDRHTTLPKERGMMWTLRTRSGSGSGVHSAHLPTSLTQEDRGHSCHSCGRGSHALLIHLPLIAPVPLDHGNLLPLSTATRGRQRSQ